MQPDRPRHARAALALLALGATLGAALDAIHTHTGTTIYTEPVLLRAAWWVPLLFGVAGVAVGLPRAVIEARRGAAAPAAAAVAQGMGLFVLAYALSGTVPGGNVARAVALLVVFAAAWGLTDRTALGLALAVATGMGGMAVEVTMIRLGLFRHLQPTWEGIPLWLPLLYMTAQVALGNLGRRLASG